MAKDSALEKWEYKEHTEVKHKILEKYLSTWITILGKWNERICYFDCFAGRGEYDDGTFGSPVRAIKIAHRKAKDYGEMTLTFIEKDTENYNNLKHVLEVTRQKNENPDKITFYMINSDFSTAATQIFHYIDSKSEIIAPSLFFVDPFGYSGVPLDIIKKILSYPKTEVFFTFMVSSITRFITHKPISKTLTALFGTDAWEGIIEKPNKEITLVELYRKQLHEKAGAKYSLHFRISESHRLRTLYYLIHVTNNLKGHYVMKDIMYNGGSKGFFAYLGPNDLTALNQTMLFDLHDINELKNLLLKRYKGKTLTFNGLLADICIPWYAEPPYTVKQYRQALKELEKEDKCSVQRISSKITGLDKKDRINFSKINK